MKKYIFGFLAITMAIGFSAFTTKKAHKPFFNSVIYYAPASGLDGISPSGSNPINVSELNNVAKWNGSAVSFGTTDRLAAIEFEEDFDGNDGNFADGELGQQEAVDALKAKYMSTTPYSLPANGSSFIVPGTSISIKVWHKQ